MVATRSNGLRLTVQMIIEPDTDGFHAYCPVLKGLHVGGSTQEETLANAADAALLFLQDIIEAGDPVPLGIIVEDIEIPANAEIRSVDLLLRPSLQMSGTNFETSNQ